MSDADVPLVGRRIGSYSVKALLGVGGMGEVYRAHDATLGRDVAIKILPDVWLADPDRRARFDREARVLASLNHPNIGAIYGLHEDASEPPLKALVLELVEGDSLAERILHHRSSSSSRRGLPVDEVTTIAAQIADALGAAHARGIIHRDLKPGNIKITPDGRVKVLDFGLARTVGESAVDADLTQSPTMTLGGTAQGVVLGTAPYVSPEQARGHAVDQRADIWAFGCLLYEMLTGVAPFRGEGIADVLASVLTSEPDWSRLPGDISAGMRVCVHCCLQKKVERRFHDIGDVRLALEGAFEQPGVTKTAEAPRRQAAIAYAGWAVAAVVAAPPARRSFRAIALRQSCLKYVFRSSRPTAPIRRRSPSRPMDGAWCLPQGPDRRNYSCAASTRTRRASCRAPRAR